MLSTFERESAWLRPVPKLAGKTLMEHLYARMDGLYPGKWKSNFVGEAAMSNWEQAWAEAFDEEGIVPVDVALGIQNSRRMYDWPPSLTEFLRACRPYLEPDVAFFEAVRGMQARERGERGEWSHPAIFHAAAAVGRFDLLNQAYQQMEGRWKKALHAQLALGAWPDIPDPAPALPAPSSARQTEQGAEAMREMTQKAINRKGKDHKAWARTILSDPKGRTPGIVRMAQAAVGEQA